MPFIIDGYNLIYADKELSLLMISGKLEEARDLLTSRLIQYQAHIGEKITIVFDGKLQYGAPRETRAGVQIIYSRPPRNADMEIGIIVQGASNPKQLKVVSSDREVRASAKSKSAKSIPSESFLKQIKNALQGREKRVPLEPSEKYGKNPSKAEIKQWLKIFDGLDPDA